MYLSSTMLLALLKSGIRFRVQHGFSVKPILSHYRLNVGMGLRPDRRLVKIKNFTNNFKKLF